MTVWLVEYVSGNGFHRVKLVTSDKEVAETYVKDQKLPARYHEITPWEVTP